MKPSYGKTLILKGELKEVIFMIIYIFISLLSKSLMRASHAYVFVVSMFMLP